MTKAMQEKNPEYRQNDGDDSTRLQRKLRNRHIQLIAISGAIGTGLFMGSGKTISLAGPSILLVYAIIGFMLFFVMRAMGELLLSNLNYKSFADFSGDLLGPWAAYFVGWTYWFCWIVTGTADVVAITGYAQHWWPDIPLWLPASGCVLTLLGLNLVSVRLFGEMEYWFSMIKIVTIVALIGIGFTLVLTHFVSPSGSEAALSNLWDHGGVFPNGILGFFAGFQIAVFAFVGIELVGTTAAETENPLETMPRAINSIPFRIIIFYVFALMAIMVVTPWQQVEPGKSPFVGMFMLIGIPAAASVINFVVMTSAASSANSGIYSTSRMLYGLAEMGVGPHHFSNLSKASVPVNALLFSTLCLACGAAMVFVVPSIMAAFTLLTTVSAVLFIFVWSIILLSYMAYRKNHPERHAASIFKMPGGVFMCWANLAFFVFVIALLMLETDTREALFVTPLWFVLLGFGYYIKSRMTFAEGTDNGL